MKSTSSRKLRTPALSLALALVFSGPAAAAWNPAATGQPGPSTPPASAAQATANQTITSGTLAAEANPGTDGYDKKWKLQNGNIKTMPAVPLYKAGSGVAPTYTSICVYVAGYAYSTPDCIASKTAIDSLYNYTAYQFDQVMQWLEKIYNYASNGDGETGTGIIGTINKNHDLDRVALEEQLALNHARMQELMMKQAYANKVVSDIQDYRVCDDLGKDFIAQGAGKSGATGRGGAGSTAKGATETEVAKSMAGGSRSEAAHAAAVYADHAMENGLFCSPEDFKYSGSDKQRNAFGCSKVGSMPDGDSRAQSVFAPAHDYTNSSIIVQQNLTFDPETKQKVAADKSIRNIVSAFSPPALPKAFESTDVGKTYLAKTKIFNARTSAAIHALSSMADRRMPMTGPAAGGGGTITGAFDIGDPNWHETYSRIFGSKVKVPEHLSEADSLRFEVYRRYYDDPDNAESWYDQKVKLGKPDEQQRESLRMASVQMLLLYNIHQRLEENNMIQAAILSQTINPVTKDEIEKASQRAQK